jgi:hypothetical protein
MHSQFLNFDLTKCRTLQSGLVDADTWTDLICPYDNDNGTSATLVQIAGAGSYSPWILHQGGVFDLETCHPLVAGRNSLFLYTGLICVRDLGNDTTRTLVQYSNGATLSQWLNGSPLVQQFNVNSCRSIRVGDVNGDVRDDLLCPYDYDNASTRTFVQFGTINYEYTGWIPIGPLQPAGTFDMNFCQALLVGDADGNGYDDLLCSYNYGGDQTRTFVQYSLGNSLTGWTAMQDQIQTQFNVASCRPLVAGDLNHDGRADLICPYDYGGGSTATFVQMSLGSEYTPWQRATETIPAGNFDLNRCRTLMSGDADGDGHTDLICPYDYGDASTATFVQAAQIYRVALPAIIH